MKEKFVGRQYEFNLLEESLHSSESELVIVYGRRRVGKTYLVNSFFKNNYTFKLTGVYKQPTNVQLERFAAAIEEYSNHAIETPSNWFKAFDILKAYLKSIVSKEKKVVFIDEMPWLDTQQSDFVSAFEAFWNGWASAEGDILLIVCGSATSWITNKLLSNKGGLFNRCSYRMFIQPFTLRETEEYLISQGFKWSRYDIAECYMIMGGIPFYLKQLKPQWTYTQNIDNIFFKNKGLLWDEFEHLFNTLFQQADSHIAVVEALSKKRIGLTRNEIIKEAKLHNNGNLSKIISDLVDNGFVSAYNYFGSKKRDTMYRLCDFYSLFYFSYIKDHYDRDPHFWSTSLDHPSRRTWAGYTFEQLCLNHIEQVKKSMGISGIQCNTSSWFSRGESTNGKSSRGAQIDLLIERRDRVINLCEMKFSLDKFEIKKDYDEKLRNKIETFRSETKTNKAIQLVMITTYGVKRNMYSNRIQSEVTLDDLFN